MKSNKTIQEIKVSYKRPPLKEMHRICSSQDAEAVLRQVMDADQLDLKEFFWVALLSRSNHVLGVSQISMGSTSGTTVNLKEIFQLVLKTNAVAIILCHNHPSGNLKPSNADIALTKRIKSLADVVDIAVLDHIILTSEGYYSLSDEGHMI